MNQKLSNWVKFGVLPATIADYQPTFDLENLCPFCDKPHNNHQRSIKNDRGNINFNLCLECNILEEQIIRENYDSSTMNDKILYYLNNRILLNAEEFFLSHTPRTYIFDTCFFCEKNIEDDDYYEMEIPVTPNFIGGSLKVCPHCSSTLQYNFTKHITHTDKCPSCHDTYPINELESINRNNAGSIGSHKCCNCMLILYGDDCFDLFTHRYLHSVCDSCGIVSHTIDRTIENSKILISNIKCDSCIVRGAYLNVIFISHPVKEWIGIKKTPNQTYDVELMKCLVVGDLYNSHLIHRIRDIGTPFDAGIVAKDMENNTILNMEHDE